MYKIKAEQSFDAAHFLYGYEGKCSQLHGHRWRVIAEVDADQLEENGQYRGMIVDFGSLKDELKSIVDEYDHTFIYESGTLKQKTIEALTEENFVLISVPFRPTAENFAKHFFDVLFAKGFPVHSVQVFETPNNSAEYERDK